MLIGQSLGGVLVFELARRLEAKQYPVAGIMLVDSCLVAKRNSVELIKEVATPRKLLTAVRQRLLFSRKTKDEIFEVGLEALSRYEPGPLRTPVLSMECSVVEHSARFRVIRPWENLATGAFERIILNCNHDQVIGDPIWVDQVAAAISDFRSPTQLWRNCRCVED
jgi:hypothetical protein